MRLYLLLVPLVVTSVILLVSACGDGGAEATPAGIPPTTAPKATAPPATPTAQVAPTPTPTVAPTPRLTATLPPPTLQATATLEQLPEPLATISAMVDMSGVVTVSSVGRESDVLFDFEAATSQVLGSTEVMACITGTLPLARMFELAGGGSPTQEELSAMLPCLHLTIPGLQERLAAPSPWPMQTPTPAEQLQPGFTSLSIEHDGLSRNVLIWAPDPLEEDLAYPMVLRLHGVGGDGAGMCRGVEPLVEEFSVIMVCPDGIGGIWVPSQTDDVSFLESILDWLMGQVSIDQSQVYVYGASNGAVMAQNLGRLSDRFAAMVAIYGSFPQGWTIPSDAAPISVLQFHGDEDKVVPYGGGAGSLGLLYSSAQDTIAMWAAHNGCSPTPELDTSQEEVTIHRYRECDNFREVSLYTLHGQRHVDAMDFGGPDEAWWDVIWGFYQRNPTRPTTR